MLETCEPRPVVRRAKAALFSGCKSHPATFAPAGSNRSGSGGNNTAEAFDALNAPVRFDERGVETEHGTLLGHRQPKGPATCKASLNHRATPRLYFFPHDAD